MKPKDYVEFICSVDEYDGAYNLSVSVVIPHYNTPTLLSRCIASLASQSYPNDLIEVIVSDDGSDQVPVASEVVHAEDLNLQIVIQERHGFRAGAARNRAIEQASGDIILCLDADMIPVEQFIEAHLRCFHVSQRVATIGPRKFIDVGRVAPKNVVALRSSFETYPDVCSVSNHRYPLDGRLPFLEQFEHEEKPYWFFYSCNIGFPRITPTAGYFDEVFDGQWGYEDIEFGYRLFRSGFRFVYVPKALAFHQENTVTLANKRKDDGAANFTKLLSKWPELEDEEPATIPNSW